MTGKIRVMAINGASANLGALANPWVLVVERLLIEHERQIAALEKRIIALEGR